MVVPTVGSDESVQSGVTLEAAEVKLHHIKSLSVIHLLVSVEIYISKLPTQVSAWNQHTSLI